MSGQNTLSAAKVQASAWKTKGEALPPVPFIVGTGRCGTTLLRLMLDAHPDLAVPPETHFIPRVIFACRFSTDPGRTFVETVISHPMWPDFHLDTEGLKREIEALNPFDLGDAFRTFYRLYADRFDKPRWGDKTPFYGEYMLLIQTILPEARFIHLIRDGRDAAVSAQGLYFAPSSMAGLAEWWASGIKQARYLAKKTRHYLEVHYEDLLLDAESTTRKICDFIELRWDPAILTYHQTAAERMQELISQEAAACGGKAASETRKAIHVLTQQPPEKSRIGRWKKDMNESDRRCFERMAGKTLLALGYELSIDVSECSAEPLWVDRIHSALQQLDTLIGFDETIILVDLAEWGVDECTVGRRVLPFLERNGWYWGTPPNDEVAIQEFERLRQSGATFIVLGWPAFWWLEHYSGFTRHLRSRFRCLVENNDLIVFDLRLCGKP